MDEKVIAVAEHMRRTVRRHRSSVKELESEEAQYGVEDGWYLKRIHELMLEWSELLVAVMESEEPF